MQRFLPFSNHPFPLMLYLEWILLGITLLGEVRPDPHRMGMGAIPLAIATLLWFALMGLRLPLEETRNKVLYTALEFGLLVLAFGLDARPLFFPLLGLVIVIRSCLIFQQLGRLIVSGLVFTTFLLVLFQHVAPAPRPRRIPFPPPPESFANTILSLKLNTAVTYGLALLFTLLLVNALLAERQSRKKLTLANAQLRQYASRIENQATLQERNRIAREIHDALGHALTAQSIQLENALLFLPPDAEKTATFLQEAKRLGTTALQEVRRSIATLRSDPLQGRSLQEAIAQTLRNFQQTMGVLPDYTIQLSQPLPLEISTAVYRIIQESLTNIYRHSAATQIGIHLREDQNTLHLQIDDNGQGFDPQRNTTGFGLQGMRERTAALGGQFFLTSQPGAGCHITVMIPIPQLDL